MPPLKTALIGCGVMGQFYARVLPDCRDAHLAAVCDADLDKARDFAGRHGVARVFSAHGEMLAAGGLDAVIVATPDFAHRAPVCDALAAGLPVLCEKPLATTLADAREMVQAQERAARATSAVGANSDSRPPLEGKSVANRNSLPPRTGAVSPKSTGAAPSADPVLMVNFGNRHRPNARRVRELIRAGELGRVQHLSLRLNERLCKTRQIAWIERTSPVWFLLSHCVDLARWLLEDRFEQVYARAVHGVVEAWAPGVPDTVTALCATAAGATVSLESSWIMPDAYFGDIDFALEVIGEQGAIHADLFPHDLQLHRAESARAQDYSLGVTLPDGHLMGWWEESTRSFFSALAGGRTPEPTAQEALEVTRTLLALDRSLAEGAVVRVEEVE